MTAIDLALDKLSEFANLDVMFELYSIPGADHPATWITKVAAHLVRKDSFAARAVLDAVRDRECAHHVELCEQFKRVERNALAFLARGTT